MNNKTVFVVDDNDEFRSSIAWMLRAEGHNTVEFASAEKALNALLVVDTSHIMGSCILLDVRMPGMSGLEFHDLIKKNNIQIPVVYMTGHADVALAVEAMKKGAVSLLEKPLENSQLYNSLELAFEASNDSISTLGLDSIDEEKKSKFRHLLENLTPRENDVLLGIVDAQANKVIASNLGISVRTVEVHRARLMKKLLIRSAPELVKMVLTCRSNHLRKTPA